MSGDHVIDPSTLNPEERSIVVEAGSCVWRIERRFVIARLSKRLPLPDGKLHNEISARGVKSVSIGIASVYWAIAGWTEGMLVAVPSSVLFAHRFSLIRALSLLLAISFFGVSLTRSMVARHSRNS